MNKFKVLITLLIVSILSLSCGNCRDCDGEAITYTYTVRNESGVPVKVLAYNSSSITPNEVETTTVLENGNEITRIHKDGLPPIGYNFSDFFGTISGSRNVTVDNIKVIYNNTKYTSFTEDRDGGNRNPLNNIAYGNLTEVFIFTKLDYENAKDCNGNCD